MSLSVWQADVLLVGSALGWALGPEIAQVWRRVAYEDRPRPGELVPGALMGMLAASRVTTRHIVAPGDYPPWEIQRECYNGMTVFAQLRAKWPGHPCCWIDLHMHETGEIRASLVNDDETDLICMPLRRDGLTGHYVITDLYCADADLRITRPVGQN